MYYCTHLFVTLQKPLGLLSLLDEESTFPKATDFSFANKLKQQLSGNSCFKGEKEGTFEICHYAGEVGQSSSCFIFKLFLISSILQICKLAHSVVGYNNLLLRLSYMQHGNSPDFDSR
jgi:hypothetical protein